MGTITIEQYGAKGGSKDHDAPIANLYTLLATTVDSTTSTTAENIILEDGASFITIAVDAAHRVSLIDDTTADSGKYATISTAGRELGVKGGEVLYYRADA